MGKKINWWLANKHLEKRFVEMQTVPVPEHLAVTFELKNYPPHLLIDIMVTKDDKRSFNVGDKNNTAAAPTLTELDMISDYLGKLFSGCTKLTAVKTTRKGGVFKYKVWPTTEHFYK